MTDYIALRVDASPCSPDITDLIADALADIGYESFEPDDKGVTAYIDASKFEESSLNDALADFPIPTTLTHSFEKIEGRDWNSEWEKNYFKPIIVADRCVVHSTFHTDVPKAEFDIVIDPKMAFGTGHHSTTRLILSYLLDMDLKGKSVIDMGTGTGILAILCAMKGASPVTGIEIDPGAWENAVESAGLNHVDVKMINGDATSLSNVAPANLFLANINRNIILADMSDYVGKILVDGEAIFSGFYEKDIPMVAGMAHALGLTLQEKRIEQDWAAVRFKKVRKH